LWLLAAVAALHLGPQCGDPPPLDTPCRVRFDTVSVDELGGGAYAVSVDVLVESQEEFQSWEMSLSWDSDALILTQTDAHADFDDDGGLALSPSAGIASAGPFVDFRHGSPAVGNVRVATLGFVSAAGDPATISLSARAARPDGTLLEMAASDSISVP
jgi:hypothetical protein